MKLIFLGAPGAGKGTQAENACGWYGIPAISTGNIIREEIKNETPLGVKAKSYVQSGGLVPDDLVIDMLKDRIAKDDCKAGFVLDGFPRTLSQAEALDRMGVEIDKVINIEVADETILRRMSGRRVCGACGVSYHVDDKPPIEEGVCDKCDGKLMIRADDQIETVKERLTIYHEQTEPLKGYYQAKGKLREVIGQEKLEDTTKLTRAAIEA